MVQKPKALVYRDGRNKWWDQMSQSSRYSWGHAQHIPREQHRPGCLMPTVKGFDGSVMLQGAFCLHVLGLGRHSGLVFSSDTSQREGPAFKSSWDLSVWSFHAVPLDYMDFLFASTCAIHTHTPPQIIRTPGSDVEQEHNYKVFLNTSNNSMTQHGRFSIAILSHELKMYRCKLFSNIVLAYSG